MVYCEWVSICLDVQVTAVQRLASVFSPSGRNHSSNGTLEGLTDLFCGEGFSANGFLAFLGNVMTRQDNLDSHLHPGGGSSGNILLAGQFRPKIFFAPNTSSVVKEIIVKANKTFTAITDLNDAMDKAMRCSNDLMVRIPPYSPQANRLDSVSVEILGQCFISCGHN